MAMYEHSGVLKYVDADGNIHLVFPSTLLANVDGLAAALGNLVPKEAGKGLSTNDFTDAYKTKLDGIPVGGGGNDFTLSDGVIQTNHISAYAVTGNKIDDLAIQNRHISIGAVGWDQLAAGAAGGTKIANGGVETSHLANGCVTDAKAGSGMVVSDAKRRIYVSRTQPSGAQNGDIWLVLP